jgi:SAM-dependent methyltransferase
MFFKQRVLQAEYYDDNGASARDLADFYASIDRVNRLFSLSRPFRIFLPELLGQDQCRSLSFLDLGAGNGALGNELGIRSREKGWDWRVTNLDTNLNAMRLNPTGRNIAGSALALPFKNGTFDVVMASQMTHHLDRDEDVVQHFLEAWRVARRAVFFNDLHRNPLLYGVLWVLLRLHGCEKNFRNDGLISVKRGWRVEEWKALAERAGLRDARVWLYGGARILLLAQKPV